MKRYLSIVTATLIGLLIVGCGGEEEVKKIEKSSNKLSFEEVNPPVTAEDKKSIKTTNKVTYQDGSVDKLQYKTLILASDVNNGEVFGALKDYTNSSIKNGDNNTIPYICDGANGNASGSGVDHSSIIKQNGRIFMVSQFECGVGAMYGMELLQDTKGELSVKENSLQYIPQTDGFGGWVHCAGVTTPWESHLGSEEYEPDARAIETNLNSTTKLSSGNKYYDEVTKYYWKDENNANESKNNNPYYYGYIPEVKVDATSSNPTYNYTKHFSMGRGSWELAYIMPDEKTAYLGDDGTDVGFFMYVADKPKDLSSGTLYAAKWIQTSPIGVGQGTADISWIRLGHATNNEIKQIVSTEPKFSDIFETDTVQAEDSCNAGFTFVKTNGSKETGKECLKLKEGKEKEAAFLETRRYAAYLGATTEFRKEEGITFNPNARKLYVSMSEVEKSMSDTKGDIKVENNSCGAVYALDISKDNETIYDSTKMKIDSSYVVKNTAAHIVGLPMTYKADSVYAAYTCSADGIANPDNLTYLKDKDILVIGEDTDAHPNDFLWSYDVVSKKLIRIASTPYGSETTSPFWYKDINGFGYLSLVVQHPFGEISATNKDFELTKTATDNQKRSSVGVVGPFTKIK